ncbi:MAG: hypothetical protein IKF37_02885 [Bacilli bacterium]|nr:hypothetical protein [Bacilli bacterium]
MNYMLYIAVDKSIKQNYCFFTKSSTHDSVVNINVYTNGKEKIDFRTINYIGYDTEYYKEFINHFSDGKNVFKNVKEIYISATEEGPRNTKKDNTIIATALKNNKGLLSKQVRIDIGDISLTDEEMESLRPLKKYKNILVTLDESVVLHNIDELIDIHDVTKEVVRRTKIHDFSPAEQMLYAYDMIRTNFMVDEEYHKKMEKMLEAYAEPSFCYTYLFQRVLDKLNIKNAFAQGIYTFDDTRAYNVIYLKDEDYDIEGIYYIDVSNNSKQKFDNSILDYGKTFRESVINNYLYFCKPKWFMEDRCTLDKDYMFGDFDDTFMGIYEYAEETKGINGIFELRRLINNVSYFVDDKALINGAKGIQSEEELEEIKNETERYAALFGNMIEGEDFLEILFNVRKEEYKENKELFPLSLDTIKECMINSHFPLSKMNPEFSDEMAWEQEDIDEVLSETFDINFEETINNANLEERIKKLKLSLNKDPNKPKNDNNN